MTRFLLILIRLFPGEFRLQFEAELARYLQDGCDRARTGGRLRAITFTLATAIDLIRSAVAERLDPSWTARSESATTERVTRWKMTGWTNDYRFALRALLRTPGVAAVMIGMLGLAIGANAGIFSAVDAVLLHPLPFDDADRLVYIGASAPGSDMPTEFGVSPEFYVQYSEQSELLEDVALYNSFTATLRVGDRAERIRMSAPTLSLFSTLQVTPIVGRLPFPEEEDRVAVISHALWTTWFGSDPDVVGRSYQMIGEPRTVVGVMGPEFEFPVDEGEVFLWIPSPVNPAEIEPGQFGAPMVARMAPGATMDAVSRELAGLAQRLPERFGGTPAYAQLIAQHRPIVRPLKEELVGDVSRALWVLLGSVGIVLLIACANVANLFMVRAEQRQRDLAIRRAIGAARVQLFRAQMAEALIVALSAGVLAVVLALVTLPSLLRAAPPNVPGLGEARVTVMTMVFTAGLSIVTALMCGLVPALRSSMPSLSRLRDGARGSTRARHWSRDGLVVAQTALALVLLIGSALLMRSFANLRHVDPGYDTENLMTFQIAPEAADLIDGPSFARFHTAFRDRVAALPGVESVGLIENVPLNEGLASARLITEENVATPDAGPLINYTFADGNYFETAGISLLAGRVFTDADHTSNLNNVVINRSAADLLWPGQDPIGRRVRHPNLETWFTVVGVVESVMQYNFRDPPQAIAYLPLVGPTPSSWTMASPGYMVKTTRAAQIAPEIRDLVREVAPGTPMYRVFTMSALAADSMVDLSFATLTLAVTSLLALILGTVGLYGVLSYVVAQRTREIGVRMALGAEAGRVLRTVVAQGTRVVLLGVAIGVFGAALTTRVLDNLLFDVQSADIATFLGMSGAMVLIGLLASYVPARRASRVDPIESLRLE